MPLEIHPIVLGLNRCYIIRDQGVILIDGGTPNKAERFADRLKKIPVEAGEINLMVITHGHPDHIGSAMEIKEMTGAKIAMHQLERECLEEGKLEPPPGVTAWGRFFIGVMTRLQPEINISRTGVDVVLGDEGLSLVEYGIPGRVLYTPGHSKGSVSVLLDNGDAFVGDLAMNAFPLCLAPRLPIFAEDVERVKQSWRFLLEQGAKQVYPAHGKPFSAEIMRKILE